MKIKKNDTVLLLTGKGSIKNLKLDERENVKTGKVLAVYPKTNKVLVEGVNIQTKHKKARTAQDVSEIVKQAGPIDASNVMVICPNCNKPTRVEYQGEGKAKVRVCKKCKKVIDAVKEAKPAKKATTSKKKDAETAPTTKKATKKSTKKVATADTTAENN